MDVILWKTMLFDKHYQSFFLVSYWIASLGITKIYIFFESIFGLHAVQMITTIVLFFVGFFFFSDHKHLVSRWCTFESMFVCQIREVWFAKNSGDISCQIWFFFLGSVWQILYFIKTELPLNIKGNAIWNNPLQDTVLLYSIFAKYIIRIFLLIW